MDSFIDGGEEEAEDEEEEIITEFSHSTSNEADVEVGGCEAGCF